MHFTGMCVSASLCTHTLSVVFVFPHTYPTLGPKALLTGTSVITFLEVVFYRFPSYDPALHLNTLDRLLLV